ncbi:MAG: M28 family peptidase [Chthoniobacterales bacterium]
MLLISCGVNRGGTAAPKELWEELSGDKAMGHVQRLVDLGPRPSGSEAIEKSRAYIEKQLHDLGWDVSRQTFTDATPRGPTTFTNLIATFHGKQASAASSGMFLLCSHYDTKIFDNIRFVGANDGGSSTGLLIELARVIAQRPELAGKIQMVFFDGEEAVEEFTDTDGLYGSRHFSSELTKTKTASRFRGGILLDMVGDRSLGITLPLDSPADLARDIFAAADAVKCRNQFTYFDHGTVLDDHTPLNAAGIPTIDLIDFDYPPWHTADDTMDKVSANSLETVGRVVVCYLLRSAR